MRLGIWRFPRRSIVGGGRASVIEEHGRGPVEARMSPRVLLTEVLTNNSAGQARTESDYCRADVATDQTGTECTDRRGQPRSF